jgi:glycosyltransferase involved in cell wall biosynthesis
MKIVNILFNHKKSKNENKVLGVERCYVDYTKYLIDLDHQLLSITKNNMAFREEILSTKSDFLEVSATNSFDLISIIRIAKSFLKFKPNIIICHSGRAMKIANFARKIIFKRIPILSIDHGINPKKFLKSDFVITVNSFFSKELIKAGKDPKTTFVMPNMMEVKKDFKPAEKDKFRNPVVIGSLGRIYPEKNFDKMLMAIKILKERDINCRYVIGGVGPEEKKLNQLAEEIGVKDNFKILGWTTDKREFFSSIDIFVLPSFGETFGIVLLEAMLYKTPIITSNSWGPDEIIDHEINGLKVSKDKDDEVAKLLADAIERYVKDQDFAAKMAINAEKKFYENYSADKVSKKLESIIKNIL